MDDFSAFHEHHQLARARTHTHVRQIQFIRINEHWQFPEAFQEYDPTLVENNIIVDFYPSRSYSPYIGYDCEVNHAPGSAKSSHDSRAVAEESLFYPATTATAPCSETK